MHNYVPGDSVSWIWRPGRTLPGKPFWAGGATCQGEGYEGVCHIQKTEHTGVWERFREPWEAGLGLEQLAGQSGLQGNGEIPAVFQREERCLGLFSKDLCITGGCQGEDKVFPVSGWHGLENLVKQWELAPVSKKQTVLFHAHMSVCVCVFKYTQHLTGISYRVMTASCHTPWAALLFSSLLLVWLSPTKHQISLPTRQGQFLTSVLSLFP